MADNSGNGDSIRQWAEACQKIVDEALENRTEAVEFLEKLRNVGATPDEAEDYGHQYTDRMGENRPSTSTQESDPDAYIRDATPDGLDDVQRAAFREARDKELAEATAWASRSREKAVNVAAWKVLEAKLQKAQSDNKTPSRVENNFQSRLAELLGESEPSEPSGFPLSVLDAAPHLRDLVNHAFEDPHLGQTWRLKHAYGKAVDSVIDGMHGQEIEQPLPRSIWKYIIEDRYVDFEKLFAAMDPGYDPNDVPKDFRAGYALIKKEHASAKHPVRTESEWIRIYAAWKDGVTFLYPHRDSELRGCYAACP